MVQIYLGVVAALFTLFGVVYIVNPQALAGAAGIEGNASGLTDIRATYGGFQVGFALFLAWVTLAPERHESGLMALALVAGLVGLCRAYGVLVDGALTGFHIVGLVFEFTLLALSAWAIVHVRSLAS